MSHVRTVVLLCVCALVANVAADPALPPSRTERKENKMRGMVHEEENSIIVKKVPIAYFYPFSLWPLPKPLPSRKDIRLKELIEQRKALESFSSQENNREPNSQKKKRERCRRAQEKNKNKR